MFDLRRARRTAPSARFACGARRPSGGLGGAARPQGQLSGVEAEEPRRAPAGSGRPSDHATVATNRTNRRSFSSSRAPTTSSSAYVDDRFSVGRLVAGEHQGVEGQRILLGRRTVVSRSGSRRHGPVSGERSMARSIVHPVGGPAGGAIPDHPAGPYDLRRHPAALHRATAAPHDTANSEKRKHTGSTGRRRPATPSLAGHPVDRFATLASIVTLHSSTSINVIASCSAAPPPLPHRTSPRRLDRACQRSTGSHPAPNTHTPPTPPSTHNPSTPRPPTPNTLPPHSHATPPHTGDQTDGARRWPRPSRSCLAQPGLDLGQHRDRSGSSPSRPARCSETKSPDQDQVEELGQRPVPGGTSTTSATTSSRISATSANRRATLGCSPSWRRVTRVRTWRVTSPSWPHPATSLWQSSGWTAQKAGALAFSLTWVFQRWAATAGRPGRPWTSGMVRPIRRATVLGRAARAGPAGPVAGPAGRPRRPAAATPVEQPEALEHHERRHRHGPEGRPGLGDGRPGTGTTASRGLGQPGQRPAPGHRHHGGARLAGRLAAGRPSPRCRPSTTPRTPGCPGPTNAGSS